MNPIKMLQTLVLGLVVGLTASHFTTSVALSVVMCPAIAIPVALLGAYVVRLTSSTTD
jgi:uncharacterized membrane protein YeaQ/YmgE (transglycosylase-associated protein family)